MRFLRDRRGAAAPTTFLFTLVLLAICATLIDLYNLATARAWADRVCQEASLQAVNSGRDLQAYITDGQVRLDPAVAEQEAEAVVQERLSEKGIAPAKCEVQVEVLPTGGAVPGFPPVGNASVLGRDFQSPDPAVGVYLALQVPTTFMRALGLGQETTVHAFAASALSMRP